MEVVHKHVVIGDQVQVLDLPDRDVAASPPGVTASKAGGADDAGDFEPLPVSGLGVVAMDSIRVRKGSLSLGNAEAQAALAESLMTDVEPKESEPEAEGFAGAPPGPETAAITADETVREGAPGLGGAEEVLSLVLDSQNAAHQAPATSSDMPSGEPAATAATASGNLVHNIQEKVAEAASEAGQDAADTAQEAVAAAAAAAGAGTAAAVDEASDVAVSRESSVSAASFLPPDAPPVSPVISEDLTKLAGADFQATAVALAEAAEGGGGAVEDAGDAAAAAAAAAAENSLDEAAEAAKDVVVTEDKGPEGTAAEAPGAGGPPTATASPIEDRVAEAEEDGVAAAAGAAVGVEDVCTDLQEKLSGAGIGMAGAADAAKASAADAISAMDVSEMLRANTEEGQEAAAAAAAAAVAAAGGGEEEEEALIKAPVDTVTGGGGGGGGGDAPAPAAHAGKGVVVPESVYRVDPEDRAVVDCQMCVVS